MEPDRLPVELGRIKVPHFFAPSQWVTLETCALAVWAGSLSKPVLLESPDVMFGSMLHKARHRYLVEPNGGRRPLDRLTNIVREERGSLEASLVAAGRQKCLPLREAVGWRKWDDRIRRLECWAETLEPRVVQPPAQRRFMAADRQDESQMLADSFAEGSEPWWQVVDLRLRGRPDEARINSSGELSITDLKTGFAFTVDGEFRPEIVVQMYLYAVMAERLVPAMRIRLYVQHSRLEELSWGEKARLSITDRLSEMSERFAGGRTMGAASVANPGSHCRSCGFRPACSAYLQRAPAWWSNGPGNPRQIPYDVWGTVTTIDRGDTVRLQIVDAAGRDVEVEGLRADRGWDGIEPGSKLYLFNLEPTEDTFRHGARIHPRNFHEVAPGPTWSDALSVSLFLSADPSQVDRRKARRLRRSQRGAGVESSE